MTDVATSFGYVSKIVDALKDQAVPIDSIIPHPNNVRKHRLDKIAQSLTAFGQVSPIIVDEESKEILKGNGTWQAAKLLGWTHIAVQYTTLGNDVNKRHYMMSDNRASDLGSYYRERLADELRHLSTEPGVNDTLWEPDEIEDLLEEVDGLAVMPPKGTPTTSSAKTQTPEEKEAGKKGTAYLKESTLLFSQAEHVRFAGMVAKLRGIYELDATHTILEAVERQYEAEMNHATQLGAIPAEATTAFAVRRWYIDTLREPLSKMGNAEMLRMVDELVPAAPTDAEVPGQQGMDDTYVIETGPAAGDTVSTRLPTAEEAAAMFIRASEQDDSDDDPA